MYVSGMPVLATNRTIWEFLRSVLGEPNKNTAGHRKYREKKYSEIQYVIILSTDKEVNREESERKIGT